MTLAVQAGSGIIVTSRYSLSQMASVQIKKTPIHAAVSQRLTSVSALRGTGTRPSSGRGTAQGSVRGLLRTGSTSLCSGPDQSRVGSNSLLLRLRAAACTGRGFPFLPKPLQSHLRSSRPCPGPHHLSGPRAGPSPSPPSSDLCSCSNFPRQRTVEAPRRWILVPCRWRHRWISISAVRPCPLRRPTRVVSRVVEPSLSPLTATRKPSGGRLHFTSHYKTQGESSSGGGAAR